MIDLPQFKPFFGEIENLDDPLKIGRVQVRVAGVHSSAISTGDLPWFSAIVSNSAGLSGVGHSPTGYVIGSTVFGFFVDPELQKGIVIGSLTGIPATPVSEVSVGTIQAEQIQEQQMEQEEIEEDEQASDNPYHIPLSVLRAAMPTVDVGKWKGPLEKACEYYNIQGARMCMLLAQIGHESNDGRRLSENLNYTSAQRLVAIWPTRFPNVEFAQQYVSNPQKLGNYVYNGRMGNRTGSDDGWNFRGKGLLQLTGRENNQTFTRESEFDTISNPDLLTTNANAAAMSSAWFFNKFTSGTDIVQVTRRINGGTIGLQDRKQRYERALAAYRGEEGVPPVDAGSPGQGEFKQAVNGGRVPSDVNRTDGNTAFYLGESDVNRLAREDGKNHWMYQIRESARIQDVRGPLRDGSSWAEPPYANRAVYPFNKTFETISGHLVEYDDTPNNERIHEYHRSGTYTEISPKGDQTVKIVGDSYQIIAGQSNIVILGDCNLSINGNLNQHVKGNWNIQVDGSKTEVVQGDMKTRVADYTLFSQGEIKSDATMQYHQSGKASGLSGLQTTLPVEYDLKFALPSIRQFGRFSEFDEPEMIDQVPDDYPQDPKSPLDTETVQVSSDVNNVEKIVDVQDCSLLDDISERTRLSTHYTVRDLTTGVAVRPGVHSIRPQNGFDVKGIACNMQALCDNILEPLRAEFGAFRINSAFRTGEARSQHNRGMAVDIQEPSWSNQKLFEVAEWCLKNLPVDQCILEHGVHNCWLHLSFDRTKSSQRGQALTMYRGKFEPGLRLFYR